MIRILLIRFITITLILYLFTLILQLLVRKKTKKNHAVLLKKMESAEYDEKEWEKIKKSLSE